MFRQKERNNGNAGKLFMICIMVFCMAVAEQVMASEAKNAENTEYEYDKLGRVTQVTYQDGSGVRYEYDANGNILKITSSGERKSGLEEILNRNRQKLNGIRRMEQVIIEEEQGNGENTTESEGNHSQTEEQFEVRIKREWTLLTKLIQLLQKLFL